MVVYPVSLSRTLGRNLSAANSAADSAMRCEAALLEAASDYSMGTAESLTRYRAFIEQVRIPAVQLHHDALLSYIADMQADRQQVESKACVFGSRVDTNEVQRLIDSYLRTAYLLESYCYDPFILEAVAWFLRETARELRYAAEQLQWQLDALIQYLRNGGMYARSCPFISRLALSQRALSAVSVDGVTGAFDLSGIDMSWVQVRDNTYWRQHNSLILSRYLIISEDGAVLGIRREMSGRWGEIAQLALRCLTISGMPSEIDNLTPDEKYVLLWILNYAPLAAYDFESDVADWFVQTFGFNPADPIIKGASALNGFPIDLFAPLISFDVGDGVFYSTDQPNSVQHSNGFCDATDFGGPFLGMDLDTCVTTFEYEGMEYRLQPWFGSYGAGLAYGGEIGLYCRPAPTTGANEYEHQSVGDIRENIDELTDAQVNDAFTVFEPVTGDQRPSMYVRIETGNHDTYVERDAGDTYWSFNAKSMPLGIDGDKPRYMENDQMSVYGELDFSGDPGLAEAAEEALVADGINVRREGSILYITWDVEDMD